MRNWISTTRSKFTTLLVYIFVFGPIGIFTGLKRIMFRNPRVKIKKVRVPGFESDVLIRQFTSDVETFYQVLIKKEYKYEPPTSPRFIIDAGANIGLTSVYFSLNFPSATIIAIEPEPSNLEILNSNVQAFPNIHVISGALIGNAGVAHVFDPGNGHWGFQAVGTPPLEGQSRESVLQVPGYTVSEILKLYDRQFVDILKLDIEGAEQEVMEHSAPWIGRVNTIVAELHDRDKRGCSLAFYSATAKFDSEWYRGELVFVSRQH